MGCDKATVLPAFLTHSLAGLCSNSALFGIRRFYKAVGRLPAIEGSTARHHTRNHGQVKYGHYPISVSKSLIARTGFSKSIIFHLGPVLSGGLCLIISPYPEACVASSTSHWLADLLALRSLIQSARSQSKSSLLISYCL